MEVTEIEGEVSVVVTCVVGVDAVATEVVACVVVEEVQPAIRRPQSKRMSRTRDIRMKSMFFRRGFSSLLCVCYVYNLLCFTNGIFSRILIDCIRRRIVIALISPIA